MSNEAESQGEDIEDVEFNREGESSDNENSQDRQMLDDSSQPPIAPVCEYARMDAEFGQSQSESDVRLPGGRKRGKRVESHQSGVSQSPRRRRRLVIMPPLSLGAEAEANQLGPEGGGQSETSSEWGDLRDDDDPTWDSDDERDCEEMREFFSVCRIDPRLGCNCGESASQVCSLSSPKHPSVFASSQLLTSSLSNMFGSV